MASLQGFPGIDLSDDVVTTDQGSMPLVGIRAQVNRIGAKRKISVGRALLGPAAMAMAKKKGGQLVLELQGGGGTLTVPIGEEQEDAARSFAHALAQLGAAKAEEAKEAAKKAATQPKASAEQMTVPQAPPSDDIPRDQSEAPPGESSETVTTEPESKKDKAVKVLKVSFVHANYDGGNRHLDGALKKKDTTLHVHTDRFGIGLFNLATALAMIDVASVQVTGGSVAKRKVGAEVAFGVLGGLGGKGTMDRTTVVFRMKDGQDAYFEIFKESEGKVRGKLAPVLRAAGVPWYEDAQAARYVAATTDDATTKLIKLGEMHTAGLLTDEEFRVQKAALLGGS